MNIFTTEEIALLSAPSAALFAHSKRLEEDREMKQKRSFELSRDKMRSGAKPPTEELYKTLKELKPTTLQMLGNRLAAVEGKVKAGGGCDAVMEFAALQSFVYDGFKATLPTDRALIFPQELGPYLCELLEQHRRLHFELKHLLETQSVVTEGMLPKLLSIFSLTKTNEIFKNRIENNLQQAESQLADKDVPGVLQLFQEVVERQEAILGFTLLVEGVLELWQSFDNFLANALKPLLDRMDLTEFANASSVVRLKLWTLQRNLRMSSVSITKVNFHRAFVKTSELLDTSAMSHIADLVSSVENGFAQFLYDSFLVSPDFKTVIQGSDLDIDQAEAMVESLDSVATCLKPQIDAEDVSGESDEELASRHGTRNPDAVVPNMTKLHFFRNVSALTNMRVKMSAKSIASMNRFMRDTRLSAINKLSFSEVEWDKRNFAALNIEEVPSEEFKLEDVVVKQAKVMHGSVFSWPKKVTSSLKRLIESTLDKYTLLAYSNEILLRTLCTTVTSQIAATLAVYEGDKQLLLYRTYPLKAIALIISNLVVLRGRQEQLYTLLRMTAKQMLSEEAYVLSHLKQQRTTNALLQLIDGKLQSELSLLLSAIDCEAWSDQKVRYTSKGVDQPSYGLSGSHKFVQRTAAVFEGVLNKEMSAIVIAKMVRYWGMQIGVKYCAGIAPSRTRLAQFLQDLEYIHLAALDTFQRLCGLLAALGEDSDLACWELFLSMKTLWQVMHTLFLTSYTLRLTHTQLIALIKMLSETYAFQPEMSETDWPIPAILTQGMKNSAQELRLHIRDSTDFAPSSVVKGPEIGPQAGYFSDVVSREFNSTFGLFLKMRGKYPGKYSVFHFLGLFCLASSNSMKEQLEKSLPIMFQNRAKAYRSYEEMVLHENNLRDFFTFPVSKFVSVVRMRSEMLADTYPPITDEELQHRKELEMFTSQLKAVEPRSASVDESAVQSPS